MSDLKRTDDGFEPFDLCDPKTVVVIIKDDIPGWAVPYLSDEKAWDNYSDDIVYEVDKAIRSWGEQMRSHWSRKGMDRRYQFSTLLGLLGVDVNVNNNKNYNKIARIFAYYSTKVQKETFIDGVRKKNVYTISPSRLRRPPYSLRLRLEQFDGPRDGRSMQLPKDDLEKGHARNPRTEANMQRRSEEARRRYNEYKRKRSEA